MLKKGIKFSLCILLSVAVLAAVVVGLIFVLKHYGLMFRAWVIVMFLVIMLLLGIALSCGIIYTLAKVYSLPQEESRKRTIQKVLSVGGIVVTLSGTVVLGGIALLALLLSVIRFDSEYVVEKYGQKMVAYEVRWLHTNVTYHEYKNFLVCGYNTQDVAEKEPEISMFPPEKMQCDFRLSDVNVFCEMSYSADGENWISP